MKERENRDQLVIATKYTAPYKLATFGKGKAANAAKSQNKTNQAAMNIVCTVCRQAFVSLSVCQSVASTP